MLIALHKNARTTPTMRAEITASSETASVLAQRFGITEQTVYKWKKRDVFGDRSHTAHHLQTVLTPAQETVALHLRRTLRLPLDDLLGAMIREDRQMQAIQQIPGVGDLTASALVAAVGDFCTFKSARQFAPWVGLVPRHVGTGGNTQQLGISKRGDTYLRTLLIAGARAVIARSGKSDWIEHLLQRRHYNVVVIVTCPLQTYQSKVEVLILG